MIKLKDEIEIDRLTEYGFKKREYDYKLSIGAFDLFCDIGSRIFNGIGFWPVGDRIILRAIRDRHLEELINVN